VILNAGGYSHTSIAIRDAVAALQIPVIEVHLSNVYAREHFRRQSFVAQVARGIDRRPSAARLFARTGRGRPALQGRCGQRGAPDSIGDLHMAGPAKPVPSDVEEAGAKMRRCGSTPALVRELADLLTETNLTEIEVEDGDRKIKVRRDLMPIAAPPATAPQPRQCRSR
jgi:hypothetical protein